MQTKNKISLIRKSLNTAMLLSIFLSVFSIGKPLTVYAQKNHYCALDTTTHELSLDGIVFQTCLPFLPDVISSASETDIVQSANILTRTPYHEISIYAIPYGLQPASDILPIAEVGIAATYQDLSLNIYNNEAIEYFDAPIIEIFGEEVSGKSVLIPNKIGDPPTGQQLISQWVTEAGERVWIVRLTLIQDSFEDTTTFFDSVRNISFYSDNLNLPSISKLLSEEIHDQEIPEIVATANDLPFPSWWNGDCNVNNFSGSFPLGGSYRGVKACGPLNSFHLVNFGSGVSQYEWQCAEHSKRYLYLAFNISPYSANGNNIVWNYSGSRLEKITNGTPNKGPNAGDVISYNGPTAAGHTAVVSSANINTSGNGTITIVEQNYSNPGSRTQIVSNWYIVSSDNATGWLHDNQGSGGSLNPPSLQSPGTGQTLNNRSVNFTWQSPNATNQNGYTIRLSSSSNPDTQPWLVDTGLGNEHSSYNYTFPSDGTFYWHMRTWNTSNQASSWVTRSFNINTSGGGGTNSWTARYFSGQDHWWDTNNFNNQMCQETINTTGLDKNYDSSAPCGNGVNDNWIAEYNATINFASGNYVFQAQNDDGLKIWLNGTNIQDRGGSQSLSYICPARSLSGNVPIRAILREEGGDAQIKITWTTDTSVCNLPGGFNKIAPSNSATSQPTNPTISWDSSSSANDYSYCIDTSNNNNCDTGWQGVGNVLSKSLSGLANNTTYYWQVRSHSYGGETYSNNNTWWSFTTQPNIPSIPQNLRITSTTPTSITMTWDDVSNETGYKIYQWEGAQGFVYLATVGANQTTYTETRVNCGWDEYYTVSAYNGNGESEQSDWEQGLTLACPTGPAIPALNSPANNSTINRTDTVTLSWNSASSATQYYAEFWGGPSINVNSGWTANTSWSLGSQWGGSYQWRVKAKNSSGQESAWSETRTLIIKPGTPSNLSPTVLSSDQIALTWTKSSDGPSNIDGYRIYRNGVSVGTVPGSSTTYQNNGLSCNTSYSFFVRAYKGSIESNSSNTVNATTQLCPPAIRAFASETRDGNWNSKSSFNPNDPIQWVILVENTTSSDTQVVLGFLVKDPNNNIVQNSEHTITTSNGIVTWGLPGITSLPSGTYTFTGSVTYQGIKTERVTTYTVTGTTGGAVFGDVPSDHPYFQDIEILYANGLTAGCSSSPLLFCPDTVMDRAQSAVFMLRGNLGVGYNPPNPPFGSTFGDNWGPGPWAQKWAQGMLQQGLTAGCSSSPLLYCPWEAMPRLQAAVFGMRLMNGNAYIPPAATGTVFADLTDTSLWYTKWAEQAYLNGLLPACGTSGGKPLFCPNDLVSRGLGAYMIVRAKNLTMP